MTMRRSRSVMAVKIEGTAGTAESLTNAEGAFNAYDAEATPNISMSLREGQGTPSPLLAIPGLRMGQIRYETDFYTAPAWEAHLAAAGLKEGSADVWAPSSVAADQKTATVGRYLDGKVYRLKGAMADILIMLRAGVPTRMRWLWTGPIDVWGTDAALLTPTYPLTAASTPRWAASTLTLGGVAIKVSAIDIGLNNQIAPLEDATVAAGAYRGWIASRAIGGTMDPEEELAATRDDHGNWLTPTELALSIAYATTSISIPKLQFINLPQGERSGASVLNATFQANRNAVAGDDEISFDLST